MRQMPPYPYPQLTPQGQGGGRPGSAQPAGGGGHPFHPPAQQGYGEPAQRQQVVVRTGLGAWRGISRMHGNYKYRNFIRVLQTGFQSMGCRH